MSGLDEALEASRPAIEAALGEAQAELAQVNDRKRELEQLIARARAALGEEPPSPAAARGETGGRLTLHEAIRQILIEHNNDWLTVREIADEVNDRQLYEKRDGSQVEPNQIHARTKNYAAMFEKDGPRIRLRDGHAAG